MRRELWPAVLVVRGLVVLVIVEDLPRPEARSARGACRAVALAVAVLRVIEVVWPAAEAVLDWPVWTGQATRAGFVRTRKRC